MKAAKIELSENTFEAVVREWFAKYSSRWGKAYSTKIMERLEKDVFPWIGQRPIGEVHAPELLSVMRPMSNNAILAALRRMSYTKDEMTPHGFRAMVICPRKTGEGLITPQLKLRGPPKLDRLED